MDSKKKNKDLDWDKEVFKLKNSLNEIDDKELIEETISKLSKLRSKSLDFDEERLLNSLKNIYCQSDNVELIARYIKIWMKRPIKRKPLVLFFAGTSGVGKTYTAELIAEALKDEGYLYSYTPMNQYQEKGDSWKLLGSATGYIGSDEEPKLFKDHSNSSKLVIVFDEIEKAYSGIYESLMQLLDKGVLLWNNDVRNFSNCIVIFTSNIAMDELVQTKKLLSEKEVKLNDPIFQDTIKDILKAHGIKNEICGRIDWVFVYNPLDFQSVIKIAVQEIRKLAKDFGVNVNYVDPKLLTKIGKQCANNNEGARPIKRTVQSIFEEAISEYNSTGEVYVDIVSSKDSFVLKSSEQTTSLSSEKIIEKLKMILPEDFSKYNSTDVNKDSLNGTKKLEALIGLQQMKQSLRKVLQSVKVDKVRNEKLGQEKPLYQLNFVFTGNPGTGKTTVARLMGEILHEYTLLSSSEVVELTRDNVIEQYTGHTAKNVTKLFDKAIGKVLFIDEAYSLCNDERDTFGKEAIDTIVGNLTKEAYMGKMAVIFAGYKDEMSDFINVNPGLNRRMNYYIEFEDYSNEELWEILLLKIKQGNLVISENCRDLAINYFSSLPRGKNFANGGAVEKLLGILKGSLDSRIMDAEVENLSKEELVTILPEDFPNYNIDLSQDQLNGTKKLEALIGLTQMKQSLRNVLQSVKADKIRNEKLGKEKPLYQLNFVFTGNPGTGKTTVARLLGEILCEYTLLNSPEVIELTRDNVIAKYQGHTGINVTKLFDKAIGKVLFIDEAYSLCNDERDTFGKEAIDTIVGNLTKEAYMGKMAVIFAGYKDNMREFINVNPGLTRRMNYYIDFEDYSNEELWEILLLKIKQGNLVISENCKDLAVNYFGSLPRGENFANGGAAENLLGILKGSLDSRIMDAEVENLSKEELVTILPEDFPNYDNKI